MVHKFCFTVEENDFGHKVWLKEGTTTHLACSMVGKQVDSQTFKAVVCHDEEKYVFLHGLSLMRQINFFFFCM